MLNHVVRNCCQLQSFYSTSVSFQFGPEIGDNMETTAPTATEKKECKGSGLDGSSFSEIPKKPSPTTLTRGTTVYRLVVRHLVAALQCHFAKQCEPAAHQL